MRNTNSSDICGKGYSATYTVSRQKGYANLESTKNGKFLRVFGFSTPIIEHVFLVNDDQHSVTIKRNAWLEIGVESHVGRTLGPLFVLIQQPLEL
jgi:hypothetical protein